jgi:hypothetical protein
MSISTAAKGTPLAKAVSTFQFVDPKTGNLTDYGTQHLNQMRNFHRRHEPADALQCHGQERHQSLTPLDASPLIEAYVDYEIFSFVAEQTSDGSVTGRWCRETGRWQR